ncbi:aromatic ring-hydroxylating oxygenase subunit alpha [Sphingomonas profundi]|uniref:aromatic ring-hydroxylating oxygenase subunit alpha n=1 Tax=Alterirhizorhabdus profundi TaxID=2681549 RepID=UPI0012E7CEA0|nr:aromatic ring-hydroxylating dioxygenase subunit alpha [Sphingomonas profundi]
MIDLNRIGALVAERREGHCLPQGLYNGAEAFEFDMTAIYGRSWIMIGFECELPKPGSYLSEMIGTWPILIVRGRDGEIRAFHNSCRHRGSILCQPGSGTAPKIVCPYHRWTYDLDGSLFAAMRMGEDFDKAEHGLRQLHLRQVSGALFVCFAEEPPAFDDFAEKLEVYLGPQRMENAKLAHHSVISESANWKLVMENGRECYHCAIGHPELARTFPVGVKKHFDADGDDRLLAFLNTMTEHDLASEAIEGSWWQLARFALNPDVVTLSMTGQHVVGKLMCDHNDGYVGSMRLAIDPHCFMHATADHVFIFSAMPVSPTETHVFGKWYVHKDAVEGVDYDVESLIELWTRTNLQDKELAENNQRGVNSPGFVPGPYSAEAESLALRFTDWYCDTAQAYLAHVA